MKIRILEATPVVNKDGTPIEFKGNIKTRLKCAGVQQEIFTWSKGIASKVGQEVEVELEKSEREYNGNKYVEYVAKLPKSPGENNYKGAYTGKKDYDTMLISYAKDLHIAEIAKGGEVDLDRLEELAVYFKSLYEKMQGGTTTQKEEKDAPTVKSDGKLDTPTSAPVVELTPTDQISLDDIPF